MCNYGFHPNPRGHRIGVWLFHTGAPIRECSSASPPDAQSVLTSHADAFLDRICWKLRALLRTHPHVLSTGPREVLASLSSRITTNSFDRGMIRRAFWPNNPQSLSTSAAGVDSRPIADHRQRIAYRRPLSGRKYLYEGDAHSL